MKILWLDLVYLLSVRKQSTLLRDLESMARDTRFEDKDYQFWVVDYCVSCSRVINNNPI